MNAGWALGAGLAAAIGSVGCVLVGYRLGRQEANRDVLATIERIEAERDEMSRCRSSQVIDGFLFDCNQRRGHPGPHTGTTADHYGTWIDDPDLDQLLRCGQTTKVGDGLVQCTQADDHDGPHAGWIPSKYNGPYLDQITWSRSPVTWGRP